MAFCIKCGTELPEKAQFCPSCGEKVHEEEQEKVYTGTVKEDQSFGDYGDDFTNEFDEKDIQENKLMAVLSYLGILVFVPIFAAPKSKFARFHANQGLVLFISQAVWAVVKAILDAILKAGFNFFLGGFFTPVYGLISFALGAVGFVFLPFVIIGIVNAVQGKAKELPIFGKMKILK